MEIKKLKKSFFGGYNKKIVNQILDDYEKKLINKNDLEKQNYDLNKKLEGLVKENAAIKQACDENIKKQQDMINLFELLKRENQTLKQNIEQIKAQKSSEYDKKMQNIGNIYALAYENAQKIIINAKEKSESLIAKSQEIIFNKKDDATKLEQEISYIENEILKHIAQLEDAILGFKKVTLNLSQKKINLENYQDNANDIMLSVKKLNETLNLSFNNEVKEDKIDISAKNDAGNYIVQPLKINPTKEGLEDFIKDNRQKKNSAPQQDQQAQQSEQSNQSEQKTNPVDNNNQPQSSAEKTSAERIKNLAIRTRLLKNAIKAKQDKLAEK